MKRDPLTADTKAENSEADASESRVSSTNADAVSEVGRSQRLDRELAPEGPPSGGLRLAAARMRTVVKPLARNVRDGLLRVGLWPKLDVEDRRVLEQQIFPYFLGQPAPQKILFVGCHWYTWHYNKIFSKHDYTTLELMEERARYGARHHIVGSCEHVADHFAPGSLDCVMFLGVIGWGLDDLETANASIAGFHKVLRPGGTLIVGWDDVPEHKPFALDEIEALAAFKPWTFPPLGTQHYFCDQELRHMFNFYQR